jgi:hypothetical protein
MTSLPAVRSESKRQPASSLGGRDFGGRDGLGFDFALLGLKPGESRVAMVRRAAVLTAGRIRETESVNQSEESHLLGELATSTYRLLDPRRRQRIRDRVQLSIFSEQDFDLQKRSELSPFQVASSFQIASSTGAIEPSSGKVLAKPVTASQAGAKSASVKRSREVAAVISRAGSATAVTLAWIMIGVAVSGLLAAGAL